MGRARRIYAAVKFVLFTMAGSLLMLVAIIYLATRHAQVTQVLTFDVLQLYDQHCRLRANLAIPRFRVVVRYQGAAVSVPYLAA